MVGQLCTSWPTKVEIQGPTMLKISMATRPAANQDLGPVPGVLHSGTSPPNCVLLWP